MARPAGLEPATLGLEGRCSIRMSYGRKSNRCDRLQLFLILADNSRKKGLAGARIGRGREIRTPDILLPKQARYQTALYPDCR